MTKKSKKRYNFRNIFVIILLIWIASIFVIYFLFANQSERASFGDSFGAINSLFSGLAFGGIIYTIFLQRQELKLQREELKLTRKELKRTANAQEKGNQFQNEQLRIQNLPILQFGSKEKSGEKFIEIINQSSNIPFDLDIWFYIVASDNEISKKEFINNFVKPEEKKYENSDITNEGFWGIKERGVYTSLPQNYKILIPTNYPLMIENLCYVFIQYRDNLKNNYLQIVLFEQTHNKRQPFKILGFDHKVVEITERIELTDDLETITFPKYAEEVIELHKSSILIPRISGVNFKGVESPWKMKKT
ncbi:hypothetical protein [Gelidibacter mesophilus]|uniref:hypothetical protein n=1 Tax=Gelidibacter mesophilus TaxID=169050 RepID=UPI0012F9F1D3|nr:hypothetical protein [Gelidibacter mesophilus]